MKISKLIIIVLSIVILLSFIPIINYYIDINSNINKSISFSTEGSPGDLPPYVYDTLFNGLSFDDDNVAINVNYVLHNNEVDESLYVNIDKETNNIKVNKPGGLYTIQLLPDNTYIGGGGSSSWNYSEYTINYTIDTHVNKLLPLISIIIVILGITTIVYYNKFD